MPMSKMDFWHEVRMQIMHENDFEQNRSILRYVAVYPKKGQNPQLWAKKKHANDSE